MEIETAFNVEQAEHLDSDTTEHASVPCDTVIFDTVSEFDEVAVKDELFAIADTKKKLDLLEDLINEICVTGIVFLSEQQLVSELKCVSYELENERKAHSEELRYINSDINSLEVVMKTVTNEQASKKLEIGKQIIEYQNMLDDAIRAIQNANCSFGSVDGFQLRELHESLRLDNSPDFGKFCISKLEDGKNSGNNVFTQIAQKKRHLVENKRENNHSVQSNQTQNLSFMQVIANLPNLLAQNKQAQHLKQTLNINHPTPTPILNRNMEANQQQYKRKPPPQTPKKIVKTPLQTHFKFCQWCDQQIHRNAPICQFCKRKIISRAAKKIGKNK